MRLTISNLPKVFDFITGDEFDEIFFVVNTDLVDVDVEETTVYVD